MNSYLGSQLSTTWLVPIIQQKTTWYSVSGTNHPTEDDLVLSVRYQPSNRRRPGTQCQVPIIQQETTRYSMSGIKLVMMVQWLPHNKLGVRFSSTRGFYMLNAEKMSLFYLHKIEGSKVCVRYTCYVNMLKGQSNEIFHPHFFLHSSLPGQLS